MSASGHLKREYRSAKHEGYPLGTPAREGGRAYADVDGLRIGYRDTGEGEPVVFLHGFPGADAWDAVVARMKRYFRCIVIETPGFGDVQGRVEIDYSLPGLAAIIARVLDTLELSSFHLVAHDTGGAIAQCLVVRWPDRVRTLVLSDCDAFDNWPPLQVKLLKWLAGVPGGALMMSLAMRVPALARSQLGFRRLVFDKRLLTRDRLARYALPLTSSRERRTRFARLLLAMDSRYTLEIVDRLRALETPTMIVWGCEDAYWTPSWAMKLYETIPGARRLELIPFAGLCCHEEAPDRFNAVLQEFIRSAVGAGTGAVASTRPGAPACA